MISNIRAIEVGKYTSFTLFANPIQYGYKIPYQSKENKDKKDREIQTQSSYRAKTKLLNLIKGNIYHHKEKPVFYTITQKENNTDLKASNYLFKKFIQRFNYKMGYQIRYVAVPEAQERGSIHYHMIIFNLPFLKASDIEQEVWKHGSVKIRLIERQYGLFNYLTKYFTKTFNDNRFRNQKRYFYSLENIQTVTLEQQKGFELYQKRELDSQKMGEYIYDVKDKDDKIINHIKKIEYLTLSSSL
jgi:hypothetical protein